jgi:hypothetical protein
VVVCGGRWQGESRTGGVDWLSDAPVASQGMSRTVPASSGSTRPVRARCVTPRDRWVTLVQ